MLKAGGRPEAVAIKRKVPEFEIGQELNEATPPELDWVTVVNIEETESKVKLILYGTEVTVTPYWSFV